MRSLFGTANPGSDLRRVESMTKLRAHLFKRDTPRPKGLMVVHRKIHSRAGMLCQILMAAKTTTNIFTHTVVGLATGGISAAIRNF